MNPFVILLGGRDTLLALETFSNLYIYIYIDSHTRQYVFHSNGSVSSSLSLFVYSNYIYIYIYIYIVKSMIIWGVHCQGFSPTLSIKNAFG